MTVTIPATSRQMPNGVMRTDDIGRTVIYVPVRLDKAQPLSQYALRSNTRHFTPLVTVLSDGRGNYVPGYGNHQPKLVFERWQQDATHAWYRVMWEV